MYNTYSITICRNKDYERLFWSKKYACLLGKDDWSLYCMVIFIKLEYSKSFFKFGFAYLTGDKDAINFTSMDAMFKIL